MKPGDGSSFSKILVPLDGSELGERILPQVARILLGKDAEVVLIHVIPKDELAAEPAPGTLLANARAYLERKRDELRGRGARVESRVLAGDPAEEIHSFSLVARPSLVAMSTHGRTGLARWIRGSVAERVLRSSPFPLLLSNPFAPAASDEQRFRKILVPMDGSELAAKVLPLVDALARIYDSEVTLLFVLESARGDGLHPSLVTTPDDALAILERFRKRLALERVRLRVRSGDPASVIVDLAHEEGQDLVALATHGHSGFSRWAFGSVAEKVLRHCGCPLLVKRQ